MEPHVSIDEPYLQPPFNTLLMLLHLGTACRFSPMLCEAAEPHTHERHYQVYLVCV